MTNVASTPADRRLTPELIASQRIAEDPRISPDGTEVLYVVQRPSGPEDPVQGRVRELWRVSASGGESRGVAADQWSATNPRWSPDGARFGFLGQATPEAAAQVLVVGGQGAVTVVTQAPAGVSAFAWAPDGNRLAYLAAEPVQDREANPDPKVAGILAGRVRLHVLDLADGSDRVISPADRSVAEIAWSPDGTRLVAVVTEDAALDSVLNRAWIAVIGTDGTISDRSTICGITRTPRWSPDGAWLAWLASVSPNDSPGTSVFAAPADGGEPRNVTASYAGSVMDMDWLPDADATLAVQTAEGSAWRIRTLRLPDGVFGDLLDEPRTMLGPISCSANGRVLALTVNRREHPYEVHVATRADGDIATGLRRLTHLNPQLEGLALGEQSIVRWRGRDGLEIDGVLITPLGYEPGRRYPVLMYVHSGPEDVMADAWQGDFWHGWGQLLAADGVVSLYPNYRGGIGRGPAFGMLSCGDLGGGEFDDIVTGLEHLVEQGIADPERTAIGGGSWGGYLSAWGATKGSAHFRAAVDYAGISDWLSMCGTSDSMLHEQVCHVGATVDQDPARFLAISPVAHAAGSRTATLILHGEQDPSDPVNQAYELDAVLRRVGGAPVETVVYPREGHHLDEPAHQADLLARMRDWVLRHGAGATDGVPQPG